MTRPNGVFKRYAEVPREVRLLEVSKADLLEAAWELASLCNEGEGADDIAATYRKLVETLNGARERRGATKIRAIVPNSRPARRADALTITPVTPVKP
jgi:hypothetical protein